MKKAYTFITLVVILIVGVGWMVFNARSDKAQTVAHGNSSNNQPSFNKKKYSVDDPNSIWVLVNKQRPLNPLTYAPSDLVDIGAGQTLRKAAAEALAQLFTAAAQQGLKLNPISGYRSYDNQISIYNNEVRQFGQAKADSESARPGHSEHQTGWAVDVGGGGCNIDDCFANNPEGKWVSAHAYEYGFIVRYTSAKQAVTGYRAEPWHIRYIGTELSTELHKENISTLEEFFNL